MLSLHQSITFVIKYYQALFYERVTVRSRKLNWTLIVWYGDIAIIPVNNLPVKLNCSLNLSGQNRFIATTYYGTSDTKLNN